MCPCHTAYPGYICQAHRREQSGITDAEAFEMVPLTEWRDREEKEEN